MEISQSTLALLTAAIALISSVVGGSISLGLSLIVSWLTRRSEERRQVRALVVQAALESWKQSPGTAQFDVFLLHMAKTADVVFDPKINPGNLEERLKPIDAMTAIMNARADRLGAEWRQRQLNQKADT